MRQSDEKVKKIQELLGVSKAKASAWLAIVEVQGVEKLSKAYGRSVAETVKDVHTGEAFSDLYKGQK